MTEKNQQTGIVKQESQALAVPSYVENEQKGAESLGGKDVIIPRLKLIQSLSDEHVDNGIAEGNFVNAITKENYGTKIDIAVILATSGNIMFEPGKKGKDAKIISRKFKGDLIPPLAPELVLDPAAQAWTKEPIIDDKTKEVKGYRDVPPRAVLVYTYIVLVNGRDMLSFSLSKTGIKSAKQLNTMLKMKNIPTYASKFSIESVMTKSDAGPYYSVKITPAGYVDKDTYSELASRYESISTANLNIDMTDDAAPKASAAASEI